MLMQGMSYIHFKLIGGIKMNNKLTTATRHRGKKLLKLENFVHSVCNPQNEQHFLLKDN